MRIPFTNLELKTFVINRLPGQASTISRLTYSGVSVTEETALNCVAVWACIRLLSETLASLPLHLYKRLPRGKERSASHPLYKILHDRPNEDMNSFTFRETLMSHLVSWGNAYAYIDWENYTTVKQLIPLRPDRMLIKRDNETGKIVYLYSPLNEKIASTGMVTFPSWRILHIPGLGFDGIMGYTPLQMARQAIGLSMATEEFGARFFGQGANAGVVLTHPKQLSKQAQENLKASYEEKVQGLGKSHSAVVLEEGVKVEKITIPPDDAQFLETRKFQRSEIAAFFHIPPHMIGDLEKATFSNIEEQALEFVVYTMRPWLVRWEQAINQKLLNPNEQEEYFAEFLVDGLLRGNIQARYQAYATGRQWGWLSSNDIREMENQNPINGGDDYYMPLNMLPVSDLKSSKILRLKSHKPGLSRSRIANSYRDTFAEAGKKIVKEEKIQILKAARQFFGKKAEGDWLGWLENFYKEFIIFIRKQIAPAVQALAEEVQPAAMNEVNIQERQDISKFLDAYTETFARRYVDSSVGQLKQVTKQAAMENSDVLEAISSRLDEWEERRPGKIGMNETVQLSNAVAKTVFMAAGITKLVWSNTSGKPCEFCQELDGQVVGIEGQFNTHGLSSAGHPPIHEGCECQIVPG